jgi:phytoene dehydrogenase-like protein
VKINIIGAGIGGLSAGIRLAAKGHEVHIFESNSHVGGKLSELKHDGYRFDTGPSMLTLPGIISDLYELAGKKASDYIQFEKNDVTCKYFYEDGQQVVSHADKASLVKEILKIDPGAKLGKYLKHNQKIFDLSKKVFLEKSLHKLSTYFSISAV